jgi:hypothetical protein
MIDKKHNVGLVQAVRDDNALTREDKMRPMHLWRDIVPLDVCH